MTAIRGAPADPGVATAEGGTQTVGRPAWRERDANGIKPVKVAYFGPDLDDPAVRRRVAQWRHAGFDIVAAAFTRRGGELEQPDGAINLGRISARSRLRRLLPLCMAGLRLLSLRKRLSGVDLFIARNVDNAYLALFVRRLTGSRAPLIYEVLDINTSCTGNGLQGYLLRKLETWALARTCLLVVSSPYFISAYYHRLLKVSAGWFLFENKVPRYALLPPSQRRAETAPAAIGPDHHWRIGWFGYLDDERSWRILARLASELPDRVSLYIRGMPYDNFDMENFLRDVAGMTNVVYGGPFRNPEDLAEIYESVDMVWSADCNELDANSKWLLTNGLYEAGYFAKPVIGLAGTAIGAFLEECGSGWCLEEPAAESFLALIRGMTASSYRAKQEAILAQHPDRFVESNEIEALWQLVRSKPEPRRAALSGRTRSPETGALT